MDLCKSGLCKEIDELFGIFHRLVFRKILPSKRPKMISRKDEFIPANPKSLRLVAYKAVVILRFHAGVTAELVYLICRGFQKNGLPGFGSPCKYRIYNRLIRCAI